MPHFQGKIMTDREFVFWLRGYLYHDNVKILNEGQVKLIKRILHKVSKSSSLDKKPIDKSICGNEADYEDVIELYKTYGGD